MTLNLLFLLPVATMTSPMVETKQPTFGQNPEALESAKPSNVTLHARNGRRVVENNDDPTTTNEVATNPSTDIGELSSLRFVS